MNQTHKDEIIRFANSKEGNGKTIEYSFSRKLWEILENPTWVHTVDEYRIKPEEEKDESIMLEDCLNCEFIGDRGVYCNKLGIMRGGLTYCSHYKEDTI